MMKRPENHFYIDKFGGKGFSIPTRWKSRNPPPPVLAPPRDNPNSNDEPTLNITTIATQVSPGLWIMNGDVTIASNEQLGLIEGSTVVTTHEFTNNGIFINIGATFITSSTFTNNGKFTNNDGFTVNLSSGQLVFNRSDDGNINIYNKNGVIVNLGNYTGTEKRILGNPVQTLPPTRLQV